MRWPYLISIIALSGASLLLFFNILCGASTSSVLGKWYWLEASTESIPGANSVTRWTNYNSCGVQNGRNSDCSSNSAAYPMSPVANFGTTEGVPPGLQSRHGSTYYLSKTGWAFLLIGLFFTLLALIPSLISLCIPGFGLGSVSALTNGLALFFIALSASLLTSAYVKARNSFRDDNQSTKLGRTMFGFIWASFVLLLISFSLNCVGCFGSRKPKRQRYSENYDSSSHDTYGNNEVQEKTRGGFFFKKKKPEDVENYNDGTLNRGDSTYRSSDAAGDTTTYTDPGVDHYPKRTHDTPLGRTVDLNDATGFASGTSKPYSTGTVTGKDYGYAGQGVSNAGSGAGAGIGAGIGAGTAAGIGAGAIAASTVKSSALKNKDTNSKSTKTTNKDTNLDDYSNTNKNANLTGYNDTSDSYAYGKGSEIKDTPIAAGKGFTESTGVTEAKGTTGSYDTSKATGTYESDNLDTKAVNVDELNREIYEDPNNESKGLWASAAAALGFGGAAAAGTKSTDVQDTKDVQDVENVKDYTHGDEPLAYDTGATGDLKTDNGNKHLNVDEYGNTTAGYKTGVPSNGAETAAAAATATASDKADYSQGNLSSSTNTGSGAYGSSKYTTNAKDGLTSNKTDSTGFGDTGYHSKSGTAGATGAVLGTAAGYGSSDYYSKEDQLIGSNDKSTGGTGVFASSDNSGYGTSDYKSHGKKAIDNKLGSSKNYEPIVESGLSDKDYSTAGAVSGKDYAESRKRSDYGASSSDYDTSGFQYGSSSGKDYGLSDIDARKGYGSSLAKDSNRVGVASDSDFKNTSKSTSKDLGKKDQYYKNDDDYYTSSKPLTGYGSSNTRAGELDPGLGNTGKVTEVDKVPGAFIESYDTGNYGKTGTATGSSNKNYNTDSKGYQSSDYKTSTKPRYGEDTLTGNTGTSNVGNENENTKGFVETVIDATKSVL